MLDEFIVRALLAGAGTATIAGVLGCFVVWRRMAYFGDSFAHSALLGVAIGIATGIGISPGIVVVISLLALILTWLDHHNILSIDSLLGILAHGALSLGLVSMALLNETADLHSYLFGDILTVDWAEVRLILVAGVVVLGIVAWNWSNLVLMVIHKDLVGGNRISGFWLRLLLIFLLAIMVAISVRVIGVLLISSMLIIPAATARVFARSPESMAIFASLFGILAVALGMILSFTLDTPTGPSIVIVAFASFALFTAGAGLVNLLRKNLSSGSNHSEPQRASSEPDRPSP